MVGVNFDNNNNRVNFYRKFKHYRIDNKKSQWKKVASKEKSQ